MTQQRSCKNVSQEFNKKRRMQKRNMNKRESHSKIWKSKSNRYNLKMKEKMLYSWKNMKILKSNKENSLKIWSLITKSLWNKMRSSMRHSPRANLVFVRRQSNGRLSISRLKECTPIFKLNSKKIKLSGQVNSTSWKSRKNNIRKIMRINKLFSNRRSISFNVIAKTQR